MLLYNRGTRQPLQHCHNLEGLNVRYTFKTTYYTKINCYLPIPVAARSKAWVYGRSLAGIVGSNLDGGMKVCLL
jgi:hypothetical protein